MKTVEEYLLFLESKGFYFGEDAIGFIYFGKNYTDASEQLTITAIELTLKIQKQFDGSFFISLLEMLQEKNIKSRKQALLFVRNELKWKI
ncbi:hypothetical protein J9303_05450 [Bacillaceae bacterium Marseille-Q3522]|nr:hypothetical protein [Bacillaceae bacterium Marseille-Q3522]